MPSARYQLLIIALVLVVLILWAARIARSQTPSTPRGPERTHLPDQPVEVPLQDAGPLPAVEVQVNGQGPYLFWMDTGGAGSARADVTLVQKLGLEVIGQITPGDGHGRSGPPMEVVKIDSIRVGGAEFFGLEAPSRDYNRGLPPGIKHVDGILGFHLFADALLTLDYPAGRLRIGKGDLPPADGKEVLELTGKGQAPSTFIEIAGRKIEAVIDSGFQGTLELPAEIAEPLLAAEPVVVGRARMVSGEFEIKEAPITAAVQIGRHQIPGPRVILGAAGGQAVLGSGLLRHFAVTFDQRHGRVRFERSTEAAIAEQPRYRIGVAFARSPQVAGLIVAEVFPGSAGEKTGLRKDDRVVAINGQPALEVPEPQLRTLFGSPEPIRLTIERAGETLELELTPQREGS